MKPQTAPETDTPSDVVPVNGAESPQYLDRAAIFAADDIKREVVQVPEWGGSVLIQGLTGEQRDSFEESLTVQRGKDTISNIKNFRAKLVARSIVDESGKRVFTDQDAVVLGQKSAAALQRVFKASQILSGLADDEVEELTAALGEDLSAVSGSV